MGVNLKVQKKEEICECRVVIENALGLHARPSAMFVELASKFSSDVFVEKEGVEINGKSIMGVMMLAAGKGTKLKIRAVGKDASEAVLALEKLIKDRFYEDE